MRAGVRIAAGDDEGREQLCRYAARPGIALERMTLLDDGRIAYRARHLSLLVPSPGDDPEMPPNVITVRHWRRLLDGLLLARSPRLDWATLLRRSLGVDALECPRCRGRLRPLDVVTDADQARRILEAAGLPAEPPPRARARDPTEE